MAKKNLDTQEKLCNMVGVLVMCIKDYFIVKFGVPQTCPKCGAFNPSGLNFPKECRSCHYCVPLISDVAGLKEKSQLRLNVMLIPKKL